MLPLLLWSLLPMSTMLLFAIDLLTVLVVMLAVMLVVVLVVVLAVL